MNHHSSGDENSEQLEKKMYEFSPSYVLFAHSSEKRPDKAAYVYLEKDDDGGDLLVFALLSKDDAGHVDIIDKASYQLEIEDYPKPFVSGSIKAVTAIGNAACGLLFTLVSDTEGIWKLRIATESGFGSVDTEECEVRIPFSWLPF